MKDMKEITIREVSNGFVVVIRKQQIEDDELVFTSIEALTEYLTEYFKRKTFDKKK